MVIHVIVHLYETHKDGHKFYKWEVCYYVLQRLSNFKRHLRVKHKIQPESKYSIGSASSRRAVLIEEALSTDKGQQYTRYKTTCLDRKHTCVVCNKEFNSNLF